MLAVFFYIDILTRTGSSKEAFLYNLFDAVKVNFLLIYKCKIHVLKSFTI